MNVPFLDLRRQYAILKNPLDRAIARVLQNGMFTLGPQCAAFEKEFARFIGIQSAIGVGTGTDALTLTLRALGLQPADEVIIPANAYPTAHAIALSGVRLRLVDCAQDGTIDTVDLVRRINARTKAIVPVHLYGHTADLYGIAHIVKNAKQKIYIIEDAAQAHGGEVYMGTGDRKQETGDRKQGTRDKKQETRDRGQKTGKGKKAGSIGDIGCFSFYPTKNLGAYGDGGVVVTDDAEIADRVRRLRMYGEKERYRSLEVSGVSRLDELQAAILRVKLKRLALWNRQRNSIAKRYMRELRGVGDISFIEPIHGTSVYHLFVILTGKRDGLKTYLENHGITTGIHYPVPVHQVKAFAHLGYKRGDFPNTERMSSALLSLPIFPELQTPEIEYVCRTIKRFYTISR